MSIPKTHMQLYPIKKQDVIGAILYKKREIAENLSASILYIL